MFFSRGIIGRGRGFRGHAYLASYAFAVQIDRTSFLLVFVHLDLHRLAFLLSFETNLDIDRRLEY
jgi:hypothetical protein